MHGCDVPARLDLSGLSNITGAAGLLSISTSASRTPAHGTLKPRWNRFIVFKAARNSYRSIHATWRQSRTTSGSSYRNCGKRDDIKNCCSPSELNRLKRVGQWHTSLLWSWIEVGCLFNFCILVCSFSSTSGVRLQAYALFLHIHFAVHRHAWPITTTITSFPAMPTFYVTNKRVRQDKLTLSYLENAIWTGQSNELQFTGALGAVG